MDSAASAATCFAPHSTTRNIDIVAVNDLTSPKTLAHLLKYDSVLGNLSNDITAGDDFISIDGKKINVFSESEPGKLDWSSLGVQVVIESTGKFTKAEAGQGAPARHGEEGHHLGAGDRRRYHHRDGRQRRQVRRQRSTTSSPTLPAPRTAWRPWPWCSMTSSRSSAAP